MVDIISKKSGPRREDVAARRLIDENRSTIEGLANQLSSGGYARRHQRPKPPQPSGLILHDMGSSTAAETEYDAYVRVSLNGRVLLVDGGSNKQLHHLGEVRSGAGGPEFVLATSDNEFYSPLDDEVAQKLIDIDHWAFADGRTEEDLIAEINKRLELV